MRRTGAVLGTIAAVAILASGAPAQRTLQAPPSASAAQLSDILKGGAIFLMARGLRGVTDVAMLADGTVVAARDSGVVVLTPEGGRTPVRGFGATGLAVAADGSVLGIDSAANVVRRWVPGSAPVVVAGSERGGVGFAGDGGPATSAKLRLFEGVAHGIAALPDGGFRFVDPGNHRIREVDAAGTIRTVAGTGRNAGFDDPPRGEGGPATAARLSFPHGLAATPDGGWLVTESDGDRLRRIRPDGTIETLSTSLFDAADIAVLPDGTAVIADRNGLWSLAPGERTPRPFLRSTPARPLGLTGRSIPSTGVGIDGRGGLMIGGEGEVFYRPAGETPWELVALLATRFTLRGLEAVIETNRSGPARLEVLRRGRVIGRHTPEVGAGRLMLAIERRMRSRWYRVRVIAGRASDAVYVHGARRLTPALARRMVGPDLGDWEGGSLRYGRCGSFGARRVDCVVRFREAGAHGCAFVISVQLRRTGVVLLRGYDCDSVRGTRLHRRPRWSSDVEMRALGPRPGYR